MSLSVEELHAQLGVLLKANPRCGQDKVVVPVEGTRTTVGASPAVEIRVVSPGFDWDAGRLIMHPVKPLGEGVEAVKAARRQSDVVSAALYKTKRILRDTQLSDSEKLAQLTALLESGEPSKG